VGTVKKLFYKHKHPIGVDISQTGIKMMAIDPQNWSVLGYGSIDLDPAKMKAALEMSEPDDTFLIESMKALLSEHMVGSLPSNHTVVGVPATKAFIRTFTLPAEQANNLADAVEVEVSQYIPLPLNALYVDYEIIERTQEQLTVIMSAVPRSIIDASLAAVEAAGLRPIMVEPSTSAIARILQRTEGADLATMIVDIGQAQSDIAVLESGAIRVSSNASIGGNTFTLAIARELNVPLDNAHQLKVINGLNPSPKQHKLTHALQPPLDEIVREASKVMRYYAERINPETKIEQLLVVGAGSNMPGIGEYFTNALEMPARVAGPWRQLEFGNLPKPNKQFRPRYLTVAGLASVPYQELYT
jgi:type IV pilus assembly protein PilM